MQIFEQLHEVTDVAVHACNHSGVSGAGRGMREIVFIRVSCFWKFAAILGERIFGDLQRQMRNRKREVKEKWAVSIAADKTQSIVGH